MDEPLRGFPGPPAFSPAGPPSPESTGFRPEVLARGYAGATKLHAAGDNAMLAALLLAVSRALSLSCSHYHSHYHSHSCWRYPCPSVKNVRMSVAGRAGKRQGDGERENVMSIVWAIANQKGGVGKSTVAVNLAAVLGSNGCRTLVCDLDPQGNAGDMLGADVAGRLSLCDIFEGRADVAQARLRDVAEGVDLLPAGEDSRLSGGEQGLVRVAARERWLSRTLEGQLEEYQYVILDCPPGLGQLTTNALVAAGRVIAPVRMTDRNAVKGLNELFRTVVELRAVGFDIAIPEILRVAADDRLLTVQSARAQLVALSLPSLVTEIPRTEAISNAVTEGVPIVLREPRHDGARAFVALAHELVPNLAEISVAA